MINTRTRLAKGTTAAEQSGTSARDRTALQGQPRLTGSQENCKLLRDPKSGYSVRASNPPQPYLIVYLKRHRAQDELFIGRIADDLFGGQPIRIHASYPRCHTLALSLPQTPEYRFGLLSKVTGGQ